MVAGVIGKTPGVLGRRDLIPDIVRSVVTSPDRVAHGLIIKDLDAWVRLEFLGVMAQTGLAASLGTPRTLDDLIEETGATDRGLLEALLALGTSLREVGFRHGRYRARGRRLRAISGSSPDLRGVVEELIVYDNPIYTALASHLGGAPPAPYDAECGAVIAAASRIAEPVLGPVVRAVARQQKPGRVLDIGCGSGIYLRHVLDSAPHSVGVGIDLDADVIDEASRLLDPFCAQKRCELRQGDVEVLASELRAFDLVTLLNNIYYWPPDRRAEVLGVIRGTVAPGGVLVVASATTEGQPYNRHLDLMLRVTASSHRLPTRAEIVVDLTAAGYDEVEIAEPVPRSGLVVATARVG